MKLLVTGGAGFVGSHLVDSLLDDGHKVTVLDDLSTADPRNLLQARRSPGFTLVKGSILDRNLVEKLVRNHEGCFHLAAALGVERIIERPIESMEINIQGSEIVLSACAIAGIRTLITSSSEIYGKSLEVPLTEESDRVLGSPLKSRWTYSEAKAIEEAYAMVLHQQQGLSMVIARLFNTVGPRQTGAYGMVIPRFVQAAITGAPLRVHGDGNQSRVFCHVADATNALSQLFFDPRINGEAVNVGGVGEISIIELAHKIIQHLSSKSTVEVIPYSDAYGAGFEDMQRRVPSIKKAQQLIDWHPLKNLDAIIDDVVEFVRARGES